MKQIEVQRRIQQTLRVPARIDSSANFRLISCVVTPRGSAREELQRHRLSSGLLFVHLTLGHLWRRANRRIHLQEAW